MTVTPQSFRQHWPPFAAQSIFPDAAVAYFILIGGLLMNPSRWGPLLDPGLELFVAHNMVLEKQSQDLIKRGGDPGTRIGNQTSKSVGDVAVGYSVTGLNPDDGHWNFTTYGIRYIELVRMVGAGPIQVGADNWGALGGSGAWPGPPVWPIMAWG